MNFGEGSIYGCIMFFKLGASYTDEFSVKNQAGQVPCVPFLISIEFLKKKRCILKKFLSPSSAKIM